MNYNYISGSVSDELDIFIEFAQNAIHFVQIQIVNNLSNLRKKLSFVYVLKINICKNYVNKLRIVYTEVLLFKITLSQKQFCLSLFFSGTSQSPRAMVQMGD